MSKKRSLVLLTLTMALLLSGCKIGGTDYVLYESKEERAPALMTVGETAVYLPETMIYLWNYKNLYGHEFGINLWDYGVDEEALEQYIKDVTIQELTQVVCMNILAEENSITLDDTEKSRVSDISEEYFASLSDEEKEVMQVTKADVEKAYTDYALANKLYEALTDHVNREVSDDEARVIHAQQIFVESEEIAMVVMEKLEKGEEFASVASSYNEKAAIDIYVARGDLPDDVENLVYNLDNGEYTEAVVTEDGFYFVKCLNKFEPELTEANKDNIRERRETELFRDTYEELLSRTTFSMDEAAWEAVSIREQKNAVTTNSFFMKYNHAFE